MGKFEVNILGCGSALPTARHYPSTQILNIRDNLFMIDCGEGAQIQFRRMRLKFTRLGHIFLSHLHGDHCFGLVGMISTFALVGRTGDSCPSSGRAGVSASTRFFLSGLAFYCSFRTCIAE